MPRCLTLLTTALLVTSCTSPTLVTTTEPINFISLGDSYTEGDGVQPADAWPALLTAHLQSDGLDITLTNLGKSGWTTTDVLAGQIPQFTTLEPNFATLFIGANDIFQEVPIAVITNNYRDIVDTMLNVLPEPDRLVLVTVPDFSKTPLGLAATRGKNIAKGLDELNVFIKDLAKEKSLAVADVHKTSNKFIFDVSLVAADALHPSEKGHALWEEIIYKASLKAL